MIPYNELRAPGPYSNVQKFLKQSDNIPSLDMNFRAQNELKWK